MDARGDLRKVIVDWLDDNFHFGDAAKLITSEDLSFLDHGILTSLGFVQLILFLEDKHAIKIDRKHLTRANFDSMRKVLDFVTAHPGFKP